MKLAAQTSSTEVSSPIVFTLYVAYHLGDARKGEPRAWRRGAIAATHVLREEVGTYLDPSAFSGIQEQPLETKRIGEAMATGASVRGTFKNVRMLGFLIHMMT